MRSASRSPRSRSDQESDLSADRQLFGIPFSLAGLAQCWTTAHALVSAPDWPSHFLWTINGLIYLVLLVAYLVNVAKTDRSRTEMSDLTFGPFTALILILPMLLAVAFADYLPRGGTAILLLTVALNVVYGGWLSGQWIVQDTPLERWHPGYFLPTVAGPLLAANGCANLGFDGLARLLLGYGLICWLTLGAIILARLFTRPALPTPLVPTLAIELAPPVVAGTAWFAINGNKPDTVAYLLAGYAMLMVIVQIRLIQLFVTVPFVAGIWAYGFSYTAGFTYSIHWFDAEQIPARLPLTYSLLGVISAGIAALAIPTVMALNRGTFIPRASRGSAPRRHA